MRHIIFILFLIFFCSNFIGSQPIVREFRLGAWGIFPWVEPNPNEQDKLEEVNANHINAWILNPNDNVYTHYPSTYPDDFSEDDIIWLEREWMYYLNTTDIGMYVGMNGWHDGTNQWEGQIEYYASHLAWTTLSEFKNVFDDYLVEFEYDEGLQGYYVSHEDIHDSARQNRIENMLDYINTEDGDPAHELVIEHGDFYTWAANNTDKYDIFEHTFYVFEEGDDYATVSHQSDLDDLINEANDNMNNLIGTDVDWHAIIQTYAFTPVSGGLETTTPAGMESATSESDRRWPTREEMFASAYLCLTRGARSIKTFLYGSTPTFDNSGNKTGTLEGLLTEDFTGGNRPIREVNYPFHFGEKPFNYVKGLLAELDVIKDVFPQIEVDQAYTATNENGTRPADAYVTTTGNWVEAGIFDNRVSPDPDQKYILLVNRVCNNSDGSPAASQTITATFPNCSTHTAYTVYDYMEDRTYLFYTDADGAFEFTYTLPPGRGRLFEVNKYSNTWSGTFYISNDLTIPANESVSVQPQSTLKFDYGTFLNVN
ncbi:MAG: hypothetical protein GF313_02765 [Caldithrix sp.]|nr:hypothetical protein [Caldithrix sp.]